MKSSLVVAALATAVGTSCYVDTTPTPYYYSYGYGYYPRYHCAYGYYWDGYRCRHY